MTGLGAALYCGFFALAALWLYMTPDDAAGPDDQAQRPERSNSASAAAGPDGSSPWLATHSSLK